MEEEEEWSLELEDKRPLLGRTESKPKDKSTWWSLWVVMQKKITPNETKKQLGVCLILFCLSCWFLLETDLDTHHNFFLPKYVPQDVESGFVVRTKGCSIPDLKPFDASIRKFLDDTDPAVECDRNKTGILVVSNRSHVCVDWAAVTKLPESKKNLTCCWRPFWRVPTLVDEYDSTVDSNFKYSDMCTAFEDCANMEQEEFIRVECKVDQDLIYKDFFAFVSKRLISSSISPSKHTNLSVLVVGIDGVSRLNFHRQMPKTVSFLNKKANMVEMLGYNKVGDNTFPNLMPVLAGKTEKELQESCWPSTSTVFDSCRFLWEDYKKKGYVTAFGEDASWMGLFQYGKVGFKKQPTDLYLRIFNHVSENEIGHEKRLNANLCVGARMNIEILLDIMTKFAVNLAGKLSFGFFWGNSLSHDYLNLPRYGDDKHVVMLESLLKEGVFEKSIVIVMSDHGIRWGGIRSTYQGFLEERLPLLIICYPSWFADRFPLAVYNLNKNAKRLTTPFDLFSTMQDFLNLTSLEDSKLQLRSNNVKNRRGISLFLEVPEGRTCQDADIADHWCTCHQSEEVAVNDTMVIRCSKFLVKYINSLLSGYRQCSKLTLQTILTARMEMLPISDTTTPSSTMRDYTVRIETVPGNAIFEATVRYQAKNSDLSLLGSISRSNRYGDQSRCIAHYKLKLYCYCPP